MFIKTVNQSFCLLFIIILMLEYETQMYLTSESDDCFGNIHNNKPFEWQ